MAVYEYRGRDRRGKLTQGKIKGDTEKAVRDQLRTDGIAVTSLLEKKGLLQKEIQIGQPRMKSQEFVIYLRQFSTLLKAGISVVDATKILGEQTSSKALKKALIEIEEELRAGNPLSQAAEKHRKLFPALFVNMVYAGEAGGNLDEILDRLAVYYEKQHKTRQKVKSALSYPIAIGLIAAIVVFFLLTFVVPTFADMFSSFGSELPAITLFVLGAAGFFTSYWWLILLAVAAAVVGVKLIYDNKQTKYYLDYFLLKLPLFGRLLQKAALARMTRTLSSLFSSSVPILQAVSIVERIVGNEVLAKVIRSSRTSLEKGESIAGPMEKHWIFPPLVTQMIVVGEKTGSMDVMLEKVADFYEDEVDAATDQIKALIEPIMLVVLAGVVGIIVASIAIPMFDIFDKVQ